MQHARHHDVSRQARAMQEEEQRDRAFRRDGEIMRRLSADRQQRREDDGGDQHHGEAVWQEAAHGAAFLECGAQRGLTLCNRLVRRNRPKAPGP